MYRGQAYIPASPLVYVLVAALLASGQTQEEPSREQQIQESLASRMDAVQQQLADVAVTTRQLQEEVDKALFDCIGTHSELCEALEVEANQAANEADVLRLKSFWQPGKRGASSVGGDDGYKAKKFQEGLWRKRRVLARVNRFVNGAGNLVQREKRGSCPINLGFHCRTNDIFEFRDWENYLNSAKSPGKKRSLGIPGLAMLRSNKP